MIDRLAINGNQDAVANVWQYCDLTRRKLSSAIDATQKQLSACGDDKSQDAVLGMAFSLMRARDTLVRGMRTSLRGVT